MQDVLEFLSSVFSFVRENVTINENVSFIDYASEIRHPDCSKLAIEWQNNNDVAICRNGIIAKIF